MRFFLFFFSLLLFFGCGNTEKREHPPAQPIPQTLTEENTYPVISIVDGDTIWVNIDGKKEKIRLVGIDTPETEKEFTPAECYADDAKERLQELLAGKKVALLKNKKGDNRDQYGRLLRYVFAEGRDINAQLIREGYAFAFRRYPHDRMHFYIEQEKKAKAEKMGMWNPENCSYW